MLKPWFGIHQLHPHFFSALIFMSVDSILINNIFNKPLQINYLAASSFCSKGEKVTHEEQLVFYTCSALFKITYFLPDQWAAFSTPLHGKAHFHVPVVLWGRWLDSPVLPSLVLKVSWEVAALCFQLWGGIINRKNIVQFPALGRFKWESAWVCGFEVVQVQFITSSSFFLKIWGATGSCMGTYWWPTVVQHFFCLEVPYIWCSRGKWPSAASPVFVKLWFSIMEERPVLLFHDRSCTDHHRLGLLII